jgi:hypothetical protein
MYLIKATRVGRGRKKGHKVYTLGPYVTSGRAELMARMEMEMTRGAYKIEVISLYSRRFRSWSDDFEEGEDEEEQVRNSGTITGRGQWKK